MKDNEIHIALASDDNYFRGLLVTVASIVKSCSAPDRIVFHVLDGGILDDNWRFLCGHIEKFKAQVNRVDVDQNKFSQFTSWHGNGRMTYARLLLPELLADVQHVIYSDVDFLWIDDIAKLWDLRKDDLFLQYVRLTERSPQCFGIEDEWLNKHRLTIDADSYFCAGMVIMNLEMLRKHKLHIRVLDVLQNNGGDAPFADQTALNVVFSKIKKKDVLPDKWQQMTSDRNVFRNGSSAVLHYAGDCPWSPLKCTNHFLTDLHILWHLSYSRIVGISVWQSLRKDNSPLMIVVGRFLFLSVCHCGFIKRMLKKYLQIQGKDAEFLDDIFRLPRLSGSFKD